MNTLPTEIVRMIMTYRGTETFEALSHEMDTVKKANQKRVGIKWRTDILDRIIKADIDDESITAQEYKILIGVFHKRWGSKAMKLQAVSSNPDA